MSRYITVIFLFLLLFLLDVHEPFCLPMYKTGFRTMGMWSNETRLRLDMNVWYPCNRTENELNYSPWIIGGAQNARPAEGRFPLLVISHASPATRFSYNYMASFFAREGFVVIAPTHPTDNMENMDDMFTWRQLEKRVKEIKICIDAILTDKLFSGVVDGTNIGFIGFGAGGTAGLLLGGATPNCTRWPAYCAEAGKTDPYCSTLAREKINNLCNNFPLREELADPKIKAFAIFAPAFGLLFSDISFQTFTAPILLVGTGKDSFNKVELHCEPLARILGKKASYLDLPSADAGALMATCPPSLAQELPELCNSVSPEERMDLHKKIENSLLAFFGRYLAVRIVPKSIYPQNSPE